MIWCALLLGSVGCSLHHSLSPLDELSSFMSDGDPVSCSGFHEGQTFADGSVVDRIETCTVVVIFSNTQSSNGYKEYDVPCVPCY